MPPFRLADCAGHWAVVTGASSGIGRAYARQLAARGLHLLLVARSEPALRELAAELAASHGVRAEVAVLDLATPEAAPALARRVDALAPAGLRLLVNNAGCGQWGPLAAAPAGRLEEIVRLNCAAVVALTEALLPALRRGAPAALVNVSSQAALQPVPYMAVYAASKAFVHSFSLALHEELAAVGVHVQTLVPGPTATDFDRRAGAYASQLSQRGRPEDVAAASLAALDRRRALAASVGGLWKQRLAAALLPPELLLREVARLFRPPPGPQ